MTRRKAIAAGGAAIPLARAAEAAQSAPHDWQVWHVEAASPVMQRLSDFHLLLLGISVAICVLVFGLIVYVLIRFNERAHPRPSRTSHNTVLEIAWTTIPVIVLVIIAVPSFKTLYYMDRAGEPELTLKVTGNQWYWDYEYPDQESFGFSSVMVAEEELREGQLRLLEVDNRVVLPVDTDIRILVTASDVLHSWAVPALGVKTDAVPGRLNETWTRITEPGVYYGQCSEICGTNHAYMPVAVEAVPREQFDRWAAERRQAAVGGEARVAGLHSRGR